MAPFANTAYSERTIDKVAHHDRRELGAVFIGGVLGTLLRVWLAQRFSSPAGAWPWTIFAINISGSFALGCLATHLQEPVARSSYHHPLLGTGFCGAYTTFSTMQIELLQMLDHNRDGLALAYALASVAAGLLAVWIGTALVRARRVPA